MSDLSNRILAFFPSSGYKSRWLSYPVLLLVALLLVIYFGYSIGWVRIINPDFKSYNDAIPKILQGQLDVFRTPVYPMIFYFAQILGSKISFFNWKEWIVAIQFTLYFISAIYLGKLGCKLIKSPKVVFWMVAFYLLQPRLSQFGYYPLTDMPGMCVTVFLFWVMLKRYPREMTGGDIIWFFVLMLVLVMLRPFFICFIPIIAVYMVICLIRYKKAYLKSFIGVMVSLAIVSSVLWAYKQEIHRLYGIHSMSKVTFDNNLFLTRLGDLPDPSLTDHPGLKNALTKLKERIETGKVKNRPLVITNLYDEENVINRSCPLPIKEEYVNRMLEKNKHQLPSLLFLRLYKQVGPSYIFSLTHCQPVWENDFTGMINITFFQFFTLVGICVLIFLKSWRRQRKLPIVYLFLLMMTIGVISASIIGAQYEWGRLSMPAVPAWLLMFAMTISIFNLKRNPDRDLC